MKLSFSLWFEVFLEASGCECLRGAAWLGVRAVYFRSPILFLKDGDLPTLLFPSVCVTVTDAGCCLSAICYSHVTTEVFPSRACGAKKALQVYSVGSGETNMWLYFIQIFFSFICQLGLLWSVLVRDCCRLPIFESLLGCNFYKQDGIECSNQK